MNRHAVAPGEVIPDEIRADVATLWGYHDMHHELRRCDVGIGLGSHDLGVAVVATRLFYEGMFPWIVFTGANAPTTVQRFPRGEAVHYREYAVEQGVPAESVLVEPRATNTAENLVYSRRLLAERQIPVRSVLIMSRPYQQRRAYATCRLVWPEVDVVCASNPLDLDDYVRLIPLNADYRVTFGDGDSLTIRRTLPELIREIERIEPGVTPRFYRFLEDACHKYRLGRSEFVERDFEAAKDFFGLRNLRLLLKTKAVNNYYRSVSKFFRTEKLRQAFSLQTMYLGLSPFEAPAVYSLLPYTELAEDGLWFPEGGMYSLIEAMERLATELGVRFRTSSPVEKVIITKGRARGVRVGGEAGGEEIGADAVLANADLPYAYRDLLGGAADADF